MSHPELSIKYNTPQSRVALYGLAVLLPAYIIPVLAGFAALIVLALYTVYYAVSGAGPFNPQVLPFFFAAAIFLSILLIPALILTGIVVDDRIMVSEDGLTLPLFMASRLGWRRQVPWTDLTEIRALTLPPEADSGQTEDIVDSLIIYFASGGFVRLKVEAFARSDLERFLLALEANARGCTYTDDYLQLVEAAKAPQIAKEQKRFTQIWKAELAASFQPTTFEPLRPSSRIHKGRIRILRKLAFSGNFAQYLAIANGDQLVMVKECVEQPGKDSKERERLHFEFDKEARTLVGLEHPQIVRVLDHFRDSGRNYLVLECFAAAQNFRQLVNQFGPQRPHKVVKWGKDIALLLDYLHNQKPEIIHGDLSPECLSPREDGKVMLVDLGWSESLGGESWHKERIPYKAPEQYEGSPTRASDVYAIGCVMHFLLTGWHPQPLRPCHPSSIINTIPASLDSLIASCTSQDPDGRPQTAGQLFQRLNDITFRKAND